MITLVISIAVSLFVGGVAALKFVAPKTKTDKDDKVLAALEKLEPLVEFLKTKIEADKAKQLEAPKA